MFDITTSRDFLAKLEADFADFEKQPGSSRLALNCAISAYHLHDWVWNHWLNKDANTRRVLGIGTKRADFLSWIDRSCVWFVWIQELATAAKHSRDLSFQARRVSLSWTPSSPASGESPRFSAPMTEVVIPEECQSIPITAPKDWNQKGCAFCGGRGAHSRRTPHELVAIGDKVGFEGGGLATASRLVAKVDSAAIQDGFDLYLHGFIVTDDGKWVVVQQGMNGERRQARRYHWLSEGLKSFVEAPHSAIDGIDQGVIVNLTDARAKTSRLRQIDILEKLGPDGIERELVRLDGAVTKPSEPAQPFLPHLVMPERHDVRPQDIVARRLHANLAAAADRGPKDFAELLLVPGVGARTVRALAQVAEVVHGAPYRFSDPARFSVAHGGKDRHPYPVPLKVYDRTIGVMKTAVRMAKLGQSEELAAIRRLDDAARRLEAEARGPSVELHRAGGRMPFELAPLGPPIGVIVVADIGKQ
jgi:hypothetical protein